MIFQSAQTLDVPYARKVLEHLIAHPDEHQQVHFGYRTSCGTTACIAGTAVLMDSQSTVVWGKTGYISEVTVNGQRTVTSLRAAELFGLNMNDSRELFFDTLDNAEALELFGNWIAEAEKVQR